MSSSEPGGGGIGKPLFVGNRIGTRPVPRVLIGNRPAGGGGGKSELADRGKFGCGNRLNGDGKFRFVLVGGKGNGQVELEAAVVVADVVFVAVTVVVVALSLVDVVF